MTDAPTPDSPPTSVAGAVAATDAGVPEAPAQVPPVAPVPARSRRSIQVPVWLLGLVVVVALVAGAFFAGRQTAPKSDGPDTLAAAVEESARGELPVGRFDLQTLVEALRQNPNVDLGLLGSLLGNGGR